MCKPKGLIPERRFSRLTDIVSCGRLLKYNESVAVEELSDIGSKNNTGEIRRKQ